MELMNEFVIFFFIGCQLFGCLRIADGCIEINGNKSSSKTIRQFWTSTGFCPPYPHNGVEFLHQQGLEQSIQLIGALPYADSRVQIRIHWMLSLISYNFHEQSFNFTYLDELVDWLESSNLSIGFELMGNPSYLFTDFSNHSQVVHWYQLIYQTGVHDADANAKFGGPGASCRLTKFSKICWSLLDHIFFGVNYFTKKIGTRLDFFSFHKKGSNKGDQHGHGTTDTIIEGELQTLQYMRKRYGNKLARLKIYNDEGDPVKGWNFPLVFRADVRYPAMVVKVIHKHLYSKDPLFKNYFLLSNDNAFLSYRPHYFTQRTLFARFQINSTTPSYTVLVRKPIYEVMIILASVRGQLLHTTYNESVYSGVIASRTDNQLSLLFWTSNDTDIYTGSPKGVNVKIPNEFTNASYIIRTLSNATINTYEQWINMGSPQNLTQTQLEILWNTTMVTVTHPKRLESSLLHITLARPGVIQLLLCLKKEALSTPYDLKVTKIFNSTVILTWKDNNTLDCFYSYILEYKKAVNAQFIRITSEVILAKAYQYTSKYGVNGYYRVRGSNILGQTTKYSNVYSYNE